MRKCLWYSLDGQLWVHEIHSNSCECEIWSSDGGDFEDYSLWDVRLCSLMDKYYNFGGNSTSIFMVLWILWRIPEIGTLITLNTFHWRCMLSIERSRKQVCFFFLINAPRSDCNVSTLYVAQQSACFYIYIYKYRTLIQTFSLIFKVHSRDVGISN